MLFLTALMAVASAAEPALTFSYRALIGASVRLEAPVAGPVSLLAEIGESTWLVPGTVVIDIRNHLKVGADVTSTEGWYAGPRAVGAHNYALGGRSSLEGGVMATFGKKVTIPGDKFMVQIGAGLGVHVLDSLDNADTLVMPLPHFELRWGPYLRRKSTPVLY